MIGFNANGLSTHAGWSYSANQSGTSWTANEITTGTQWGNPGFSPFDGAGFSGWYSDPSLAPVTDPSLSEGGLRVMYTMMACTNGCTEHNDVIIALSRNGGQNWNHTSWVSGNASQGGGQVDNPWIATNPIANYHSFVAWTAANTTIGWLAQVAYSAGSSPVFSATNYTQIPRPPGLNVWHPRIAVGQFQGCNPAPREAVFVAYATTGGRCPFDGTPHVQTQSWYLDVYDVTTHTWLNNGPFLIDGPDASWPLCVGGGSPDYGVSNDGRPHIAVDYGTPNGYFFISHTVSGANGTRANTDFGQIVCSGGENVPTISHDGSPDPCDPDPNGVCQWTTASGRTGVSEFKTSGVPRSLSTTRPVLGPLPAS